MTCISHLQLCTVAMTATLAWPICYIAGAKPEWLHWHFAFLAWAWLILGGFAAVLAVEEWLIKMALRPAEQQPLAWCLLATFLLANIAAAVFWLKGQP